ncbi:unnamed protein product, partial [Lymnaea stagnalis]
MEMNSTTRGANNSDTNNRTALGTATSAGDSTNLNDLSSFVNIMTLFVTPAVCGLGLIGNVISLCVLLCTGLKKSSYVFLFALTFSDSCWLLYALDASRLLFLYGSSLGWVGWEFPQEVAYGLFVMNHVIEFVANLGGYCSTTLPVAIMAERCLAVFYPLKFHRLVTAKRAWIAVLCVCLFWLPWCLHSAFLYSFFYFRYRGVSFGLPYLSPYYIKNRKTINLLDQYLFSSLASWVPVILVIAGAVVLGVKIKISHRKRQGLLSSTFAEPRVMTTRTTRTLVSVSVVFAVLYGYGLLTLLIKLKGIDAISDEILTQTRFLMVDINSSMNFVIYLMMNGKFRK